MRFPLERLRFDPLPESSRMHHAEIPTDPSVSGIPTIRVTARSHSGSRRVAEDRRGRSNDLTRSEVQVCLLPRVAAMSAQPRSTTRNTPATREPLQVDQVACVFGRSLPRSSGHVERHVT